MMPVVFWLVERPFDGESRDRVESVTCAEVLAQFYLCSDAELKPVVDFLELVQV